MYERKVYDGNLFFKLYVLILVAGGAETAKNETMQVFPNSNFLSCLEQSNCQQKDKGLVDNNSLQFTSNGGTHCNGNRALKNTTIPNQWFVDFF